jgi:hypothetical protein
VVAFAVPYQTPHGRRVFSGAYEIASTPLADYLGDAIPIGSSVLYLVDTPVEGPGRWVPWLVLVAFAVAALLIVVQLTQHLGSRARRRRLERDLSQQRELSERLLLGLSALGRECCWPSRDGPSSSTTPSASIGVAAWDGQESAEELVARADSALYAAKEVGRDRYVIA